MKIWKLVTILGSCLTLFGCAGYATGVIYEVDKDVKFGKKVDRNMGMAFIFPYFGTGPGLKDFKFRCEGFSCVTQKTRFGMPGLEMAGITPVPFIPFWSSKQENIRHITLMCSADKNTNYDIPKMMVHTPLKSLESEWSVVTTEEKDDITTTIIEYRVNIEYVDFDTFNIEIGGVCNDIRIPYVKKRAHFYMPFWFFVND